MLTFDAVTTYAQRHWYSHASRCVATFRKFWEGIELRTYTDEQLEDASDWLPEFKARHKGMDTSNYRFDAVRFAHKIAAIQQAFRVGTADCLIWIDADCVTHEPVTREWLTGLIGSATLAMPLRSKKYPECGFVMIRRNDAGAKFIAEVVRLYATDRLFKLKEWHDCEAMDYVRKALATPTVSLSGDAEDTSHPIVNGPLGAKIDHLKGKRKIAGKSKPSDIKRPRSEAYWRK